MGNECQTKTSQPSHGSSQIRSQDDDDFRFVYNFTLSKTVFREWGVFMYVIVYQLFYDEIFLSMQYFVC